MPVQVSAVTLPTNGSRKAEDEGPNVWGPATHVGDSDVVRTFWLQPGTDLAVTAIWVINQWMEKSFSLFLLPDTMLFKYVDKS